MHVEQLWRYPVKSMRGERLAEAALRPTGIAGDRHIVVASPLRGRVITARTHPGLLGLQGSVDADGVTLIEGVPWNSAEALAMTQQVAGGPVLLVDAGERTERFDVLPLLVATDGAIRALAIDLRRLRPNVVIGGVDGHSERDWSHKTLRSGAVAIVVAQRRARCVMATFDPDTLEQDSSVLRTIVKESGGKLGLDCSIARSGPLHEGDPISLDDYRV
jgi:hypothetical protein